MAMREIRSPESRRNPRKIKARFDAEFVVSTEVVAESDLEISAELEFRSKNGHGT